jgi:hypothetical protein
LSKTPPHNQTSNAQEQAEWIVDKLYPIRHKVLSLTTGNHERRIADFCGYDISKEIAKHLGVPYDPDGMHMVIKFGNNNNRTNGQPFTYDVSMTHGWGGARTRGAKMASVERFATFMMADVYCISHDHVVDASPMNILYRNNSARINPKTGFKSGKFSAKRAMLVKTNAYIKYGSYSRFMGYPPTDLTTPIIFLAGEEKPWPNPKHPKRPEVRVLV